MVLCHDASSPRSLAVVRNELAASRIELPSLVAVTKVDEADPGAVERLRHELPELEVVCVSVLDDASLDRFRDALWRLTGLTRIFLRPAGKTIPSRLPCRLPSPSRTSLIASTTSSEHAAAEHGCGGRRRGSRVSGSAERTYWSTATPSKSPTADRSQLDKRTRVRVEHAFV
jgi:hypothetical protein